MNSNLYNIPSNSMEQPTNSTVQGNALKTITLVKSFEGELQDLQDSGGVQWYATWAMSAPQSPAIWPPNSIGPTGSPGESAYFQKQANIPKSLFARLFG